MVLVSEKPRVFISFSRVSAAATGYAQELRNELETTWRPFLDERDVEVDEPWNPQIQHAIATCQAAIVLLTPRVVGIGGAPAPWVLLEASILRFRKTLQHDFKLITILMDGLQPEQLGSTLFEPLKIADLQLRFGNDCAEDIVTTLSEHASLWGELQPDELRAQEIQGLLKPVGKEMLIRGCQELSLDTSALPWAQDPTWRDLLARQFARRLAGIDDILDAADALGRLGHCPEVKQKKRIIKLVAANWVSCKAATSFREAVEPERREENGKKLETVAIPVRSEQATKFHVHRASGEISRWSFTSSQNVNSGERALEELKEEIFEGLKRSGYRPNRRAWKKRPWIVAIPRETLTAEILQALRVDFPECSFVVYDPEIDEEWVSKLRPGRRLEAPTTDEHSFFADYGDAINIIETGAADD